MQHVRAHHVFRAAALTMLVLGGLLAAYTTLGPAPGVSITRGAGPTPGPTLPPPPGPPLPAGSGTLTRGPYLQDVTAGAATIVWQTAQPGVGGLALRSGAGPYGIQHEPAASTTHVIRATDLQPATLYAYRVLAGADSLGPEWSFHTAPAPGAAAPLTFAVWGDSGCGCPEQQAIADRVAAAQPALALHTGDLIYEQGEAAGFDPRFFTPYRATLATAPLYPALGNHDVLSAAGAPWLQAFYLPDDNGAHTTRYYSFTYGNAHFIALDSEEDFGPTSAQYNWLVGDLASPAAQQATWRFAFFHRPPYSSGLVHGSSYDIRETWGPLFELYGVDIVFNGHEHSYERTTPRQDYTAVGGTHPVVYVVTGGGGKDVYNVGHKDFTAASAMVYHFVLVHLAGPHLRLEAVGADGALIDATAWTRP